MTSEIIEYCFYRTEKNFKAHHIKNYFSWINCEYIAFIEGKKSKILFFKKCYSSEEYYELMKFCNKYDMFIKEWTDNYLLVIESKNKNINKNIVIELRT